jgi:hypothetical protein
LCTHAFVDLRLSIELFLRHFLQRQVSVHVLLRHLQWRIIWRVRSGKTDREKQRPFRVFRLVRIQCVAISPTSCLDVCRPSSSGPLKKLAKIRKQGALEISTYLLAMKVNVDEVQQRLVVTLMV